MPFLDERCPLGRAHWTWAQATSRPAGHTQACILCSNRGVFFWEVGQRRWEECFAIANCFLFLHKHIWEMNISLRPISQTGRRETEAQRGMGCQSQQEDMSCPASASGPLVLSVPRGPVPGSYPSLPELSTCPSSRSLTASLSLALGSRLCEHWSFPAHSLCPCSGPQGH